MKMKNYFTHDLKEAITRGKQYFKLDGEFYIYIRGVSNQYFITANKTSNDFVKHFKNTAKFNEKPQWIEETV